MDGLTSEVTTLTVTLATILAPIPTLTLVSSFHTSNLISFPFTVLSPYPLFIHYSLCI